MSEGKPKLVGAVLWLALAAFLIAAIAIPLGMAYWSSGSMAAKERVEMGQLIVSILGLVGAVAAFTLAVIQYLRAEKWKRIEFIAKEIKEFESDPVIQNALTMIDWGIRRINLYNVPTPKEEDFVKITREIQWKALLPHPLKQEYVEYRSFDPPSNGQSSNDHPKKTFTVEEAQIRDTYDALLTRLDRFANFIQAGLISPDELKAFIVYWVCAITENKLEEDVKWRFALLAYINYYEYSGVKFLLGCYHKDISTTGPIFDKLRESLDDKTLAARLSDAFTPSPETSVLTA
jgi:hypothetical protein